MQQLQQQQPQPLSMTLQQPRLKPILKQSTMHQLQSSTTIQITLPSTQPTVSSTLSISSTTPASPTSTPALTPAPNSKPVPNSSTESDKMDLEKTETDTQSEIQEHLRWRRKVPGVRLNKRMKRIRLNQRLRKTLQPKNAIMVLNEMKAGVQFTFPENQGPMSNSLYLVHAELDGKTYVGQGLSKPLARQNAAENALKALLLEKMTSAAMKARMDAENDGQGHMTSESTNQSGDNNEDGGSTLMETTVDDSNEIPWSSLASFALYKLFLEWHNQGTSVPVPRPGLPSPVKPVKKEVASAHKTPVQKELPPNATSIHPVMLLNQMRPGLVYVELNRVGNPPYTMFTLAVEVDGIEYTGTAKNKKDAKKVAAKGALLALYDLSYPDDAGKPITDQPDQMA